MGKNRKGNKTHGAPRTKAMGKQGRKIQLGQMQVGHVLHTATNGVRRNRSQSDQTGESFLLIPAVLVKQVWFTVRVALRQSAKVWHSLRECRQV